MGKIKLLHKKVGEKVNFIEVDEEQLLNELYKTLNATYIENLTFQDIFTKEVYVLLLDENGKFNGKEENTIILKNFVPIDVINGDYCIGKVDNSEIVSVNENQMSRLVELINKEVSMIPFP